MTTDGKYERMGSPFATQEGAIVSEEASAASEDPEGKYEESGEHDTGSNLHIFGSEWSEHGPLFHPIAEQVLAFGRVWGNNAGL